MTPYTLPFIELILVIVTLAFVFIRRTPKGKDKKASGGFHYLERKFHQLARKKTLSVLLVGLFVLVSRATLIPVLGIPFPQIHDEFSYLLAGDTFAHGRLTNLTPPMWQHFESFHIIMHPTYMSMYPPGQGLVLALGERLGHPWLGVLLITALMCSSICWMLQGWVPPGWALYGGGLAALRLGIVSYWMNSYFATSVSALGGALVLGALPRLRKHGRACDAVIMAIGLAILANTRPYEGFILSIPIFVSLMIWFSGEKTSDLRTVGLRIVLPMSLILILTGGFMCYYFWRVTGNPFRMPYQVNRATYSVAPYFIWQHMPPDPTYHNAAMRDFYLGWERSQFLETQSLRGLMVRTFDKFVPWWFFYLDPALTVALLGLPCIFQDRKMRFVLWTTAFFLAGMFIETWTIPHYTAPATALLYLLLIQCLRHLRRWRWNDGRTGRAIVRLLPLVCIAMVVLRVTAAALEIPIELAWPKGNVLRGAITAQLKKQPGPQLVIVHYSEKHNPHKEWVYNDADIDHAKVVWARDLGACEDAKLLQYFSTRKVWTLTPDEPSPHLEPFSAPDASGCPPLAAR